MGNVSEHRGGRNQGGGGRGGWEAGGEPEIASGFPAVYPSSPLQGDNIRVECFAWGT